MSIDLEREISKAFSSCFLFLCGIILDCEGFVLLDLISFVRMNVLIPVCYHTYARFLFISSLQATDSKRIVYQILYCMLASFPV